MEKHDGGKEAKTEERRNAGPEGGCCCSKAQITNLQNASPDFTGETSFHIKNKLKYTRFILTV